jgi:hypothetical protein
VPARADAAGFIFAPNFSMSLNWIFRLPKTECSRLKNIMFNQSLASFLIYTVGTTLEGMICFDEITDFNVVQTFFRTSEVQKYTRSVNAAIAWYKKEENWVEIGSRSTSLFWCFTIENYKREDIECMDHIIKMPIFSYLVFVKKDRCLKGIVFSPCEIKVSKLFGIMTRGSLSSTRFPHAEVTWCKDCGGEWKELGEGPTYFKTAYFEI